MACDIYQIITVSIIFLITAISAVYLIKPRKESSDHIFGLLKKLEVEEKDQRRKK